MKTAKKAVLVLAAAGVAAGASAGSALAGGHGHDFHGAHAKGIAAGSPGLISGNLVQVPLHVPVNACGLTVDVVGLLNPAFGNTCVQS